MATDPAGPLPAEAARPIALSHLFWLGSLIAFALFLVLEPLQGFPIFGSDTGEYYALTASIAATGHLPTAYYGWGTAYPNFPGIFLISSEVAGATGSGVLPALATVVPALAALSVAPLFLLFRRLFPNDTVAIIGAGLGTVAFPRIFSLAHPAPLALGDLLVVASLWMFVEGRRDARWYAPLALSAGALIVTHHLSSYFFAVSAFGGFLVLELYRPTTWSRRFPIRELAFLGAFLLALFAFWFGYATAFLPTVTGNLLGDGPRTFALFEAAAIASVVVAGLMIRYRRSRPYRSASVGFPSDASTFRDFVLLVGGTLGGVLILTLVPLPGTTQTTTIAAVLLFLPILLIIPFAAGTRRLVTSAGLGPFALAWLFVVGASAILALATSDAVVSPARHAEYLVIPLAILAAIGIGRLVARLGEPRGRPAVLAGGLAVALLIGANGAIAYPPPSDFGGFQEGLTPMDAALWGWAAVGLPPPTVVASDHRVSSLLFGFDGFRATWDSTPALFIGSDPGAASADLNGSYAPHTVLPIDAVAIDATMRTSGVALDPSAPAAPMSAAAAAWFDELPFVPIYENGPQAIYWVDGPGP